MATLSTCSVPNMDLVSHDFLCGRGRGEIEKESLVTVARMDLVDLGYVH